MIYAKRIVPGVNRFYSGHFQSTPNVKTFFGYAWSEQIDHNLHDHVFDDVICKPPLNNLQHVTDWSIMADFLLSSGVNHQKYEETWLKLRKDLVTRYVLSFCQLLYYWFLFWLYPPLYSKHLLAMLCHVVYRAMMKHVALRHEVSI